MSEDQNQDGTPVWKVFLKLYLIKLSFFIVVPAYAILGASLLRNYVLYTLGTLLVAYGTVEVVIYVVYIIDVIITWIRSGFKDDGDRKSAEDYSPSILKKIAFILILANILMWLLRYIFPADAPIHEFTYFPIRVLVLQAVATAIVYKAEQYMDNIF